MKDDGFFYSVIRRHTLSINPIIQFLCSVQQNLLYNLLYMQPPSTIPPADNNHHLFNATYAPSEVAATRLLSTIRLKQAFGILPSPGSPAS